MLLWLWSAFGGVRRHGNSEGVESIAISGRTSYVQDESSTNDQRKRLRANSVSSSSSSSSSSIKDIASVATKKKQTEEATAMKRNLWFCDIRMRFLLCLPSTYTLWFFDPDEHPVAHENRWTVHGRWLLHWAVRAREAAGQCAVDSAEPFAAGCECWHGNVRLKLLSALFATACVPATTWARNPPAHVNTCG